MYKQSATHMTPNGRLPNQQIGGGRSTLRISVEPILGCQHRVFLVFLKELFVVAFGEPGKIPNNPALVISSLEAAKNSPKLSSSSVELVQARTPRASGTNPDQIFIVEVKFRPGKTRPSGVPISGDYQGNTRHFVQKLFV